MNCTQRLSPFPAAGGEQRRALSHDLEAPGATVPECDVHCGSAVPASVAHPSFPAAHIAVGKLELRAECLRALDVDERPFRAIRTGATGDWLAVHKRLGIS